MRTGAAGAPEFAITNGISRASTSIHLTGCTLDRTPKVTVAAQPLAPCNPRSYGPTDSIGPAPAPGFFGAGLTYRCWTPTREKSGKYHHSPARAHPVQVSTQAQRKQTLNPIGLQFQGPLMIPLESARHGAPMTAVGRLLTLSGGRFSASL